MDGDASVGNCGPGSLVIFRPVPWYDVTVDENVALILRVAYAVQAVPRCGWVGFKREPVHGFEPGFPAFVTIAPGSAGLFLSEHDGDARLNTLIYLRGAASQATGGARTHDYVGSTLER